MPTKKPKLRKRKGVKLKPTELKAPDLFIDRPEGIAAELTARIERDGGKVLCAYREPLGGNTQIFAALPIDLVEPTPFQRDVSDAHVRKLTLAMDRMKRYLDPIIAVKSEEGYLTPNGNHRLTALKELGAKTIPAIVVPDTAAAYQILAMNIEKAHNLREKSLEVARMYEELCRLDGAVAGTPRKESDYALEFEEPAFATLGFAYLARPRLSGGAYQPALKRVDAFLPLALPRAREERERRARLLLELDDAVATTVAKLKERGLVSPYLKSFVVARVNPLRFIQGELPSFEELMATMTKRARGMKTDRIRVEDLSRAGGIPGEGAEEG